MRNRLVVCTLLVAALAACGGGSPATTSNTDRPAASGQPTAGQPSAIASAANGQLDCATLKTAAAQLLMVQFLAQLKTPDTIAAVKAKQIGNLDLDAFLTAMHDLHALDSHPSVLGDPKAAIDFYEEAGKAAQTLFATEPMTQAAIDAYNVHVGTIEAFLGHQAPISAALGEAGC